MIKTVAGVKHEYHLNGSQIVYETWVENGVEHFILYIYDEMGAPIGLSYRNSSLEAGVYHTYFFENNLQGFESAISGFGEWASGSLKSGYIKSVMEW